jgi:hypothetical protein
MFKKLLELVAPFSLIAKELAAIRELYEAECAKRGIYLITESPKKGDTEVFYGDEIKEKSSLRKMMEGLSTVPDDEEDM